jgi:alkylhydroperoxidase/carboxymuconolactone decarboxylase family protein YurZ
MPHEGIESPLLDLINDMTALSFDEQSLDERTRILVRIAALVASDAPPQSYALNFGAAEDLGIEPEEIRDVLGTIAPIVGTVRTVAAIANIVEAKALPLDEFTELDDGGPST